MNNDLVAPCVNCGRPVRLGVLFCDIVCKTEYAQTQGRSAGPQKMD
jgi:hypothetical protein